MAKTVELQIANTTRTTWDTRSFLSIVSAVFGRVPYTLSVVLIGDTRARTLNRTYRNKTTASNVLSFPLSTDAGEIFINLAKVKREAHRYGLSATGHAQFLLIHACLHLNGYQHGSRMEQAEQKFLKRFSIR